MVFLEKGQISRMKQKKTFEFQTGYLLQDLGLQIFLGCILIGSIMEINVSENLQVEFLIMMIITFLGVVLAAFRFTTVAFISVGLQVIIYSSYKIFFIYTNGFEIQAVEFIWLLYPVITVGSMALFINRSMKLEMQNGMLREQIEKLVLIDPLTGLYNLKSLYMDLQGQTALSVRRNSEITLMIISLRYKAELNKVMGKKKFDLLKQRIAARIQDSLRIEDKVYAIDENGTIALILFCGYDAAGIVKSRVLNELMKKEAMSDIIIDKIIKLDFQIAYLQYDFEKYGKDIIGFKQRVESELQYDV